MKNKSKLKKMKEKKAAVKCPKEWLYLNEQEISLRVLADAFDKSDGIRAQLWEEAGVIEVELPEAKSVDMEWLELPCGEEAFDRYLEEQKIQTVYLVTIAPDEYEKAEAVMKQVVQKLGGYFCGDNENFTPVVR